MMTYKEANQILKCSLSPNDRCICKKTALENHAQAALLAQFAQNRLVPVSRVQKQYYIVYKAADGSVLKTEWREPGETLNPPAHPSIEGKTPNGWAPNYTGVATGDAEYTAQYSTIQYTITFLKRDGSVLVSQAYDYGARINVPTPPQESGYEFTGWSPSISEPIYATSNATYQAQYREVSPGPGPGPDPTVTYTIRFFAQLDDHLIDTQQVISGGTVTEPDSSLIEVEGYNFMGWSPSFSPTASGNVDYHAQYQEKGDETSWNNVKSMIITYHYTDGADLDSATFLSAYPKYYWGYNGNSDNIPNSAIKSAIIFSGDDTGQQTGTEVVKINLEKLGQNISGNSFYIDCYCNWFGTEQDAQGNPIPAVDGKYPPVTINNPDNPRTADINFDLFENADWTGNVQESGVTYNGKSTGNLNSTYYGNASADAVKAFYTKAYRFTYYPAQQRLIYEEYPTNGIYPLLWASYPGSAWRTNYGATGRTYSDGLSTQSSRQVPVTITSTILDTIGSGTVPANVKLKRSSSSDNVTVKSQNGDVLGTLTSSSSEVTVSMNKFIKTIILDFAGNKLTQFVDIYQVGGPEYAECTFHLPTEEVDDPELRISLIYDDDNKQHSGSESSYSDCSHDGTNPSDYWITNTCSWCHFYTDSSYSTEMQNSSQKAAGAVSNLPVYYSMDVNNSYFAREATCGFKNEAGASYTNTHVKQGGRLSTSVTFVTDSASKTTPDNTNYYNNWLWESGNTVDIVRTFIDGQTESQIEIGSISSKIDGSVDGSITYSISNIGSGLTLTTSDPAGHFVLGYTQNSQGFSSSFNLNIIKNGQVIATRRYSFKQEAK